MDEMGRNTIVRGLVEKRDNRRHMGVSMRRRMSGAAARTGDLKRKRNNKC